MMRQSWAWGLVALVGLWGLGCSSDDRPAAIDPGSQYWVAGGGAGGQGTPVDPDLAVCDEVAAGTSFTGDVNVYADETLQVDEVATYGGIAELRAVGSANCWSVATYDGTALYPGLDRSAFVLEGLDTMESNPTLIHWVEQGTELFPSLMLLYSGGDAEAFGEIMAFTVGQVETIFDQAGVTRLADRAHIVFRVYRDYSWGLELAAGVELAGGTATVAYFDGTWSTSATVTGADGLVAVLNLQTASEAYELRDFVFLSEGNTERLPAGIRRGHMTYAPLYIAGVELGP